MWKEEEMREKRKMWVYVGKKRKEISDGKMYNNLLTLKRKIKFLKICPTF